MKKMHFNLREEKGASAVVVLLTVFTFICILTGILTIVLTKAQGQSKSDIRIQEIYGNDVNRVDEIYNEVLEDINKDSKRYTMTFDYNIDDKYKNDRSTDTNYKVNWGQNFTIETTIRVENLNQRYLVIGSYDNNSQKELNIEINQSNQLRVFLGKNLAEFCDGTIHKDEDIKVTFSWNKSQNRFNINAKGTLTNIEFSERFEMSGIADQNLKVGCKDNRSENFSFSTIYVKGLKIKEYKRESVVIDRVTETALVRPYYTFNGWYTQKNNGTKINENITINDNTTVYANWTRNGDVEVDGEFFTTITGDSGALNAVPENSGEYTTIKLWNNLSSGEIEIPTNKKVILDCQTYSLSNSGDTKLIWNKGYLKVVGGTITSSAAQGTISNESTGNLEISGGRILATGTKQAVWNNGGTVTISGDSYLNATSSNSPTVHNLTNGTMTITDGTIISENQQGVKNESGTLTIGIKDGNINTTTPKIQGKTYGITSTPNYYLYDGIILGKDNTTAADREPTSQYIEDNSSIIKSTMQVDGVTYKSLYVESNELVLYKTGNTCDSITGGWEVWSGDYSYNSEIDNQSYLYATASGGPYHFGHIYLKTKNKIDISKYSSYKIKLKTTHMGNDRGSYYGLSNELETGSYYKVTPSGGSYLSNNNAYSNFTEITGQIDSSIKTDPYYFFVGGYIDANNTSQFYIESIILCK